MNLYEKIAAEIITAFTIIAALVAFLDDRRKKRREERASNVFQNPPIDKCDQLKSDVTLKFKEQDDKHEKLKDRVGDAFNQIAENRTRIIMTLEFLKNKSF